MTAALDLSEHLDQIAEANPNRPPLRPDPMLYEAFAFDREVYPRIPTVECPHCHRPARPTNVPAADAPGTALRVLKDGTCRTCYYELRSKVQHQHITPHQPCNGCGKPLRPYGRRAEDFPGTVRHSGRGLCRTCHRREQLT